MEDLRIVKEAMLQLEQIKLKKDSLLVFRISYATKNKELKKLAREIKAWKKGQKIEDIPHLIIYEHTKLSVLSPAQMEKAGWVRAKG